MVWMTMENRFWGQGQDKTAVTVKVWGPPRMRLGVGMKTDSQLRGSEMSGHRCGDPENSNLAAVACRLPPQ